MIRVKLDIEAIIQRPAFASRVTSKLLQWVEDRTGTAYLKIDDGHVLPEDDTFECECCEGRFHSDESRTVHRRLGTPRRDTEQSWCETCRDNHSFYCHGTETNYSRSDYTRVTVNGEYWCQQRCDLSEHYYWDCDEEYHNDPEPESENDSDDSGVAGYQELKRPWRSKAIIADRIGVELETYTEDPATHAQRALSLGLLAERDGSLDSYHGVEIIGPPMLMAEYNSPNSPWFLLFQGKTFKAWDAGTEYGMHVNLNRYALDKLHQAKIVTFIHNHKPFCEHIAGRKQNQWSRYTPKRIGDCKWDSDKYEAAAMREGRIEVRIFRATAKWESFMKNVEFCDAVRCYTSQRQLYEINLSDFLSFVSEHVTTWPNLNDWLMAKGAVKSVKPAKGALVLCAS